MRQTARPAAMWYSRIGFLSSGRGVSAHELEQALASYERLTGDTAHRAVRVLQRRRQLARQSS